MTSPDAHLDLIDAETLTLERDGGGRCQLAALFRYLTLNPAADISDQIHLHTYTEYGGGSYTHLEEFARRVWDDTDYPERLNKPWKPQIDAFNNVVRELRCHREYELLAEKLRELGWPGTRSWLDQRRPRPGPPSTPGM